MNVVHFDDTLDVRDLNCSMSVVKARQRVTELEEGQVLRVLSADRGSVKDFQGWAKIANNIELLAQESEMDNGSEIFIHFVQRAN